ncbi:hypothetical protein EC957_002520 [Mortierella hygrophila]|uniref:Uncharacterized protein n=1 Tax=Mortierella hygrophila TaxID=979708 RepID=A0A9P6K1V5_9FUNG|nr:hypothetical protein EC957_002520 [Mortierella hygrophila]
MLFKSATALLAFAGLVAAQGTPSADLKHGAAHVTNLNASSSSSNSNSNSSVLFIATLASGNSFSLQFP